MGLAASQEQATTPVRGMFEAARQTFDDARVRQLFASKTICWSKEPEPCIACTKRMLGQLKSILAAECWNSCRNLLRHRGLWKRRQTCGRFAGHHRWDQQASFDPFEQACRSSWEDGGLWSCRTDLPESPESSEKLRWVMTTQMSWAAYLTCS